MCAGCEQFLWDKYDQEPYSQLLQKPDDPPGVIKLPLNRKSIAKCDSVLHCCCVFKDGRRLCCARAPQNTKNPCKKGS
jgi:hypothetical protein